MTETRSRHKPEGVTRFTRLGIRMIAILWPGAFMHFVDAGYVVLPFYAAAAFQALSAFLFRRAFLGTVEQRREGTDSA